MESALQRYDDVREAFCAVTSIRYNSKHNLEQVNTGLTDGTAILQTRLREPTLVPVGKGYSTQQ